MPVPVQKLRRNCDWSTEQLVAQIVVAGQFRQPPLPLQSPSSKQVVAADFSAVQVPIGSALPDGRLVQAPSDPGTPQLWQEGQIDEPQQNPLVQKPLLH